MRGPCFRSHWKFLIFQILSVNIHYLRIQKKELNYIVNSSKHVHKQDPWNRSRNSTRKSGKTTHLLIVLLACVALKHTDKASWQSQKLLFKQE